MDAHRDRVQRDAEQVMRLDELEALVHQGRGVDRDLGTHRPFRMVERLFDRDLVQVQLRVGPERTAARGDDQPAHVLALLAPEALPDRAVLRIDGTDTSLPGCLHDQRAGHHQHLFGRQRDLFARVKRGHRRRKGPGPWDGDDRQVTSGVRHHRLDLGVEFRFARVPMHEVFGLPVGRAHAFAQPEQLEARRVAVDHVERLPADRPGGAEDGDVEGSHQSRWKSIR